MAAVWPVVLTRSPQPVSERRAAGEDEAEWGTEERGRPAAPVADRHKKHAEERTDGAAGQALMGGAGGDDGQGEDGDGAAGWYRWRVEVGGGKGGQSGDGECDWPGHAPLVVATLNLTMAVAPLMTETGPEAVGERLKSGWGAGVGVAMERVIGADRLAAKLVSPA